MKLWKYVPAVFTCFCCLLFVSVVWDAQKPALAPLKRKKTVRDGGDYTKGRASKFMQRQIKEATYRRTVDADNASVDAAVLKSCLKREHHSTLAHSQKAERFAHTSRQKAFDNTQ